MPQLDRRRSIPAHLAPQGETRRDREWGQCYRLTEAPPDGASPLEIIAWLAVERSARWRPKQATTYCNVYAHDLCDLLGAYIPRVWWSLDALEEIGAGREVRAVYGVNVFELSANALFRWLDTQSDPFGWRRTDDLTEAQEAANAGRAVVICARRTVAASPGHISVVAPESDRVRARRDVEGRVTVPVQSQAGGRNVELGAIGPWWTGREMAEWGCWIHGPSLSADTPIPVTKPESRLGREKSQPRMAAVVAPIRAGAGEHTPIHEQGVPDPSIEPLPDLTRTRGNNNS